MKRKGMLRPLGLPHGLSNGSLKDLDLRTGFEVQIIVQWRICLAAFKEVHKGKIMEDC
jgi:hypothetical protein